ncbi:hypothetical protein Celaphus_00016617 [Cervus elaphus hippelaphus]|uniref:Uncharacterized protein n=1 Tax=Cervus elaphus hippelaphus TaxID=46360 RepID=A0A212C3S4_CEREH|nr:hypothetical protein Celaphus_00016617 [Cervus elaphus hippelaphus]
MLRKEIHDKSEELYTITLEKDKWSSEVVDKENRIQVAKAMIKNSKMLKIIILNLSKSIILEENAKLNQEIGNLSKEAQELGLDLVALKTEFSHKTQEFQQKATENQERLKEVKELKEQLESRDSRLHITEKENTLITEKLQQTLVEVKTLTQEKDDQK